MTSRDEDADLPEPSGALPLEAQGLLGRGTRARRMLELGVVGGRRVLPPNGTFVGIGADEKAYRSVNRLSAPHDDVLTSLLFDRAAEAEPGCRVEMEARFRF